MNILCSMCMCIFCVFCICICLCFCIFVYLYSLCICKVCKKIEAGNLSIYFDAASRHPALHWGSLHIRNHCDDEENCDDYDYDYDCEDYDDCDYESYDKCSCWMIMWVKTPDKELSQNLGVVDWLKMLEKSGEGQQLVEEAERSQVNNTGWVNKGLLNGERLSENLIGCTL